MGLNIFTIAVTDMIMPPNFTDLFHVYIGTFTNMFKLNTPLSRPGEGQKWPGCACLMTLPNWVLSVQV